MLNEKDRTVLKLIKSALTGEKFDLPEDFSIADYMQYASYRQIDALIYYGAVNCGLNSRDAAVRPAFKRVCAGVFVDEMQQDALKKLYAEFDKNGIDYMTLKGINLKEIYPKRDMRTMSDADILIREKQYKKIEGTMKELGYEFLYESDHELVWESSALVVELHKCLIPSNNKKAHEFFKNVWEMVEIDEKGRYRLKKEDEFIHLFTHFAKHYRGGGIGIKHLTDLWVFKQTNPNLDEKYIIASLGEMGIGEFYKNVNSALNAAFSDEALTDKAVFVLKNVLNSGAYGLTEYKNLYTNTLYIKEGDTAKKAILKRKIRLIFPTYTAMRQKYSILQKWSVLLPIMWFVRIFDTLLFKSYKIKNQKQKFTHATAERTDDYVRALEYVGFDMSEVKK